ncbi:Pex19-domain-containing protein [Dichomitus squalens]|uniref:Pex19-domain-containing protein n=1 Tax=Dichomitus squalens TaxID=114155 RepID=A0A4Q9MPZ8_9APHY|nr:Pex19-domain-containing protein [Dichomitus squalens]
MVAPPPRKVTVEEDDLDDLDDVLEQFSAPPKPAAQPATAPSSSSKSPPPASSKDAAAPPSTQPQPKPTDPLGMDGLDDDFARELMKGMESLFRDVAQGAGLDDVPHPEDAPEDDSPMTAEERQKVFQKAWEAMLIDSLNEQFSPEEVAALKSGGKGKEAEGPAKSVGANAGPPQSFQENIERAMHKLKESNQKADEASATGAGGLEDMFARLANMTSQDSEEEMKGMLETMMSSLMSKDVLYEPLKELHEKFPGYLKEHDATLSAEDKTRYQTQFKIVAQIVTIFEDPSYSEDDPQSGVKVVELMQEMQDHGSPPSEIMGPLPPGFELGTDGLPKLPEGCTIA